MVEGGIMQYDKNQSAITNLKLIFFLLYHEKPFLDSVNFTSHTP